jgi:hypothetical protein
VELRFISSLTVQALFKLKISLRIAGAMLEKIYLGWSLLTNLVLACEQALKLH